MCTKFKLHDVTAAFRLPGASSPAGEQTARHAGNYRLCIQRRQVPAPREEEQLAGGIRAGLPGEETRWRGIPEGEEGLRGATARQTPKTRLEFFYLLVNIVFRELI